MYPSPGSAAGVLASNRFAVTVSQNGVDFPSYVNRTENNQTDHVGNGVPEEPITASERSERFESDTNHWTSFAFEDSVQVRVALTSGSLSSVEIRPRSAGINAQVSGGVATFTINEPGQYAVFVGGLEREPLFIFANDVDTNVPDPNASNVFTPEEVRANPSVLNGDAILYFEPGIHVIAEPVLSGNGTINVPATEAASFPEIPSNTTVYLAGGAYVKGLLHIAHNVTNVHVRGQGVLSGFDFPHQNEGWDNHAVWFQGFNGSSNISVSDITIVDPPLTTILGRAGALQVDNVKILAWHRNSDGVSTGAGGRVTDSFFKLFDDVVKLFHNDITVDGLTIWHQQTGSAFQLSWNVSGNVGGGRVSNIDVIAVDRNSGTLEQTAGSAEDFPGQNRLDGPINNALVNVRNLNGGTVGDVVLNNIRFDERPFQIIQAQLKDHRPGFDTGIGNINGITIQNVTAPANPLVQSYILDNGVGQISNISQNIRVNGSTLNNYLVTEQTDPR